MGLVTDLSALVGARRRRSRYRVLLVDETSIIKRHNYVTVVADGGCEVLSMLPGRSKADLSRFFIEQGARWRQEVKTVVTDGSHPYRAAIEQYLPTARHVLDRGHAARWFAQGLTQVMLLLTTKGRSTPHGGQLSPRGVSLAGGQPSCKKVLMCTKQG